VEHAVELSIEATYEDGVLKPAEQLPLAEHVKVQVTVHTRAAGEESDCTIPCSDPQLIEWAAMAPELEFPLADGEP
jgi:hypothetical protein